MGLDDGEIEYNPDEERVRRFFNMQIQKLKRVASIGSLILLVFNLSLLIYPYIEHRNVHPYLAIPTIFVLISLLILLLAHAYLKWLDMYRTEQETERYFNPYAVYAFQPWDEMVYRYIHIPMLEAVYHMQPEGNYKRDLEQLIKKLYRWVNKGYIPKEDFPDHLKKYYITNRQARL